jgi:hypothetical protein
VAESVRAGRPVFVARSVAGDPRLTWPRRYLRDPLVHVLDASAQVVEAALAAGRADAACRAKALMRATAARGWAGPPPPA